jgi:hypothetical protein
MILRLLIAVVGLCFGSATLAQTAPPLGESANRMLGTWEFSNAERDKTCTADFKSDAATVGNKVAFDSNCAALFPLVANIAGWKYPDNDLLYLLNAQGEALVEFSEVEDGMFEAPTPGLGVLFLQKPGAANPPARPPDQVAGNWVLKRGDDAPLCSFALAMTPVKDGFALSTQPGCDGAIAKLAFTQWRLDKGELVLLPAKGTPWRFVEIDDNSWARVPESTDQIRLVRQ